MHVHLRLLRQRTWIRQAERAIAFLRQRARGATRQQKKLALVLDIDETTLSNYEEMQKADFAYDSSGLRRLGGDGQGSGDSGHSAALQGGAAAGRECLFHHRAAGCGARGHGAESARSGL